MSTLTERQREILDFVTAFIERERMAPTLAEIAAAFGFSQARSAQQHLQAIQAKGHLSLLEGKARGIRVHGKASLRGKRNDLLSLPILGRVAAGVPIGAAADFDGQLRVDRTAFSPMPDYLLKVKGESMRDDGILDGDLVAVQRASDARNGQIVVARLEDEITIKRLKTDGRKILLLPRNPEYAPIVVPRGADFAIEGLYCGLVRLG
ncbi:transcriptional repressor LexA [Arenimonas oryziterrae]|uniref:LexA repressor n=1 Tax=Arenimonas oryziterrae DSM 21050 = YC6267 TaxID=1121015 RepID=A0A091ANQ9_9GAMM|nr:transcriptional repressor LexA [Arenimonas oryziterrae]KFN40981.1 umuDC operon protein-like protein [Arenimonas oryziterrae DSM 21050 = YC6267]